MLGLVTPVQHFAGMYWAHDAVLIINTTTHYAYSSPPCNRTFISSRWKTFCTWLLLVFSL